jgi:hypothetical protein
MTRAEAVTAAGETLAPAVRSLYGLDGTSVEDAARAAWTPSGPALPVLIAAIAARRTP